MGKSKLTVDKSTAGASIIITVAAFAIERIIEIFCEPSRPLAFALMASMAALFFVVVVLLLKNNNAFYGLLAALIGYKMLPPAVLMVKQVSHIGEAAYYLLTFVAGLVFMALIVRFYRMQESGQKIEALPILAIMFAVPMFTKVGQDLYGFIMTRTGNMLYYYFTTFALYIIASAIVLAIAYKANYTSMRFVAYYELLALGINILRRFAVVIAHSISGEHTSRSYFVWIAIFAALIIVFFIAKNLKSKEEIKALEK